MTQQPARDQLSRTSGCADSNVRIVTGVRAANQCIAWIGAKSGVFAKYGIDVTFPRLEVGGPESVAGLLRHDWDFAQTGTVPVAEAVLNGGDAVILLRDSILHDNIIIMASPEIAALDQLMNKKVGVLTDAYSGQTGVIVRLAVERAGATASYVGLGTYRNIFAALAAGDIDAGAFPIDFQFLGHRQGRWNCFETHSLRVPAILATTRRLIAADRDLVLRVMRGFVETMHIFKTQASAMVPLLQEFVGFSDRSAVECLQQYYASVLPVVPRPALSDGMQDLRDLFSQRFPAARELREADIADASLIDELEQSGFVAQLYDRSVEVPAKQDFGSIVATDEIG
jgi:ABC-type nitrate/sulfonate/bicarbonate transport system substrate-binding protein